MQLADGDLDPTLAPTVLSVVNPAAATTGGTTGNHIGIYYETPSISGQSQPGGAGTVVSATFTGWVQNNGNDGNVVAQLAKADSAGDCSNPTVIFTSNEALLQHPNTEITGNFTGLVPGGAYCWRFVATVPSGVAAGTYTGNWEYFATIGSYAPEPRSPSVPAACGAPGRRHPVLVQRLGLLDLELQRGGDVLRRRQPQRAIAHTPGRRRRDRLGRVSGTGGISCPGSCARTYSSSASPTVTLTAAPNAGSRFAGWSGGGCSGTGPCTVKMNANQSVTATFTKIVPPSCSVKAVRRSVALKKTKHGPKVGTLRFKVTCNQAASVSLTGKLVEKLRHGSKTFHLGPSRGNAATGKALTLSLKLPSGALKGLRSGRRESLTVSARASNSNGAGLVGLKIGKVGHTG